MIGFAESTNRKLLGGNFKQSDLQRHVCEIFDNQKFIDSIRRATSDELAVKNRIEAFQKHLDKF